MELWSKHSNRIFAINDSDKDTPIENMEILGAIVKQNLHDMGVKALFPIQTTAIKNLLEMDLIEEFYKRTLDVCVCSPTGSGKTLCYAVPIVESFIRNDSDKCIGIVICPSFSLCHQIKNVFSKLHENTTILSKAFVSGNSLLEEKNYLNLIQNKIIITTPLRLKDHLRRNHINYKHIKFIIYDEADKLVDEQHGDWLSMLQDNITFSNIFQFDTIHKWWTGCSGATSGIRKMYLSATLADNPNLIVDMKIFNPTIFYLKFTPRHLDNCTVESKNCNATFALARKLKEIIIQCDIDINPMVVMHLCLRALKKYPNKSILVFTNNVLVNQRLVKLLRRYDKMRIGEYSSTLTQRKRQKVLKNFSSKRTNILVTTDTLSRGIDLPDIRTVINYNLPADPDTYLHRVGRTCRAKEKGVAITLTCDENFENTFNTLQKLQRRKQVKIKKIGENKVQYLKEWYMEELNKL